MQITLSVRHGRISDALRHHSEREVEGLKKYFEHLVEADITIDQQRHGTTAEIRLRTSTDTHFARAENRDPRMAMDAVIDKMRRQLKRHKQKLTRHKLTREEHERLRAARSVDGDGPPDDGAPVEWDRISCHDAIAGLELSGEEVLVFVDSLDGTVRIARRDEAGSVSVVAADAYELEER
jgi:putative sigma-54 modulation protein